MFALHENLFLLHYTVCCAAVLKVVALHGDESFL